tara:strand:- start:4775 stop:5731 length:957 start_codon:yes stop_codon:yes gene_type:complete
MYNKKIIIVIPCFKVKEKILEVIESVPAWISKVICVDDCCPEKSGEFIVKKTVNNDKILTLFNKKNLGVGGATIIGFKKAKELGAELIIKIDGDNQMDLKLLNNFINPIINNEADYVKGNRFTKMEDYFKMPFMRKIGNIFFSLINRFSSGYWNLFDTTNGYLCFNAKLIDLLPLKKISCNFFFESDLLNWLYILRVRVKDVAIKSIYNNEKSNIKIMNVIFLFPILYLRNFFRRFFYEYCLRNPDIRFLSFVLGIFSLVFGIIFSFKMWKTEAVMSPSVPGTVAIALFFVILGINFISYFLVSDLKNYPKKNLLKFK